MTDARRPALVAAVYLGTFIAALDVSIVSVALPSIQTALHTDIAGLQWVVGAYALCLSAFMLPCWESAWGWRCRRPVRRS